MSALLALLKGSPRFFSFLAVTVLAGAGAGAERSVAAPVDFERDVRPIFEKHCIECHGSKKQKGDLRLDAKGFAFRGGKDGVILIAHSPERSSILEKIESADEDIKMPPKGDRLSSIQVATLRRWIEEGAVWNETEADRAAIVDKRAAHWSVTPVAKTFPHEASIDHYVGNELRRNGLDYAPEADRRTLIRRLSFDLLGLPPTLERTRAFERDSGPDAYERLVDELLASPHYGERWARHWLDIAHYADTHGFERDQLRPNAWRYRDYVIRSLNADKRYDLFLKEQIAGDVLFPENAEAVVATGFLAAGPWDYVGQIETKSDVLRRAARAADLDDMVTQVLTSTMGLTINCARCHDHKLDPISQEEYYKLWSVFSGLKRGDRDADPVNARKIGAQRAALELELRSKRKDLLALGSGFLDLADVVGGGDGTGDGKTGFGIHLRTGKRVSEKLGVQSDFPLNQLQKVIGKEGQDSDSEFVKAVFVPDGTSPVLLGAGKAISGLPKTNGQTWDAIRKGPLNAQRTTTVNLVDYSKEGHSILGMHANGGIVFDLAALRKRHGLRGMRLTAVVGFGAGKEAADTKGDFSVFVDDTPRFQALRMLKKDHFVLNLTIEESANTLTLIATDGGDGIGSDLLFLGDARLVGETEQSPELKTRLEAVRSEVSKIESRLKGLPEVAKVYAVTTEDLPAVVRVQKRGNPEDLLGEVAPGALRWPGHGATDFGDNSMPEGRRRAALADWIVDPANPLTRRVIVNRLWQHHFGRGIVGTPSDFGLGGEEPSHPELLAWLADQLLQQEWSLKKVHRLILMSRAYRQDSRGSGGAGDAESDSQNRLLWRQNPRRLDAESLRDAVLQVSGRLNPEAFGPGYRDFKYFEAYAPVYEYVTPDKSELWRRSIYRFVVRTTPHRFMGTLDCPDPANLTPVRNQTTTALQALSLSNNEFMLQQAKGLAERIEHEGCRGESAVERAFEICFQRTPSETEKRAAAGLQSRQGLFAVCRMLLNTNEFLYVD